MPRKICTPPTSLPSTVPESVFACGPDDAAKLLNGPAKSAISKLPTIFMPRTFQEFIVPSHRDEWSEIATGRIVLDRSARTKGRSSLANPPAKNYNQKDDRRLRPRAQRLHPPASQGGVASSPRGRGRAGNAARVA